MMERQTLRGILATIGCFLVNLVLGSFHGTFGNLLPYFSSYIHRDDPDVGFNNLAQVYSIGNLAQGINYIVAGLVVIPILGHRGSLLTGSLVFVLSYVLTYWSLDWGVAAVTVTYGVLGGISISLIVTPSILIPFTWFPDHKGKISGLVCSGIGLSATVFSGLQSYLINPNNLAPQPECSSNQESLSCSSSSLYFVQDEILSGLPTSLLILAAGYSAILLLGLILAREKPTLETENNIPTEDMATRLKVSISHLVKEVFTDRNFYLLFVIRFLLMTVVIGYLSHWKTLLYTKETNDFMVSILGGGNGIVSCVSRILSGFLLDRLHFPRLMSSLCLVLSVVLASTYTASLYSFPALVVCVWCVFFLVDTHFTTIPAQASILFESPPAASVAVCVLGVTDVFAAGVNYIINATIMSQDSDSYKFLWLLIILASCSLLSMILCLFVSTQVLPMDVRQVDEPSMAPYDNSAFEMEHSKRIHEDVWNIST